MKHAIKMFVRGAYARILYYTGLHLLVSRLMPQRLTILAGHCVANEEVNGDLPADMKISGGRLEQLLRWFSARYEMCTVGDGVAALEAGTGRSLLALSMDDGYRDNRTVLMPLLDKVGARATVYLESRALEERRVNWSHKVFWLFTVMDPEEFARQYMAASGDAATNEKLRRVCEEGGDLAYLVKRVLKYDAERGEREGVTGDLFRAKGGDERALCDRIYLNWDEARELQAGGVELGGHTATHAILSRLARGDQDSEVGTGRAALERELGADAVRSFAYPFGRRWDFDDSAAEAVRSSGFQSAVTTHAGTNHKGGDSMRLARWMIDEDTPLHLLAAEACGGFALLRRFGIDLSE